METCSICGKPRDTKGTPHWCKECRAAYKREYEETRKTMNQNQGAALGIETMRKFLAQRFAQYGSQGSFSGIEIARIIMAAKVPEIPKQREEPEAKTA